ncbi:unnamed protein product [Dibothriocephalus latus]|uniref:Uncharacterized protein n=1 Tax=Dibothriocephalus latus TaxID=60516 RepID=A0A3P6TWF2_DIBLA|nr:unnamed protein product [Dibothriocephalus latus]
MSMDADNIFLNTTSSLVSAHSVPNIELSCAVSDADAKADVSMDSDSCITKSSSVERLVRLTRRLTECKHVFAALEKEEQKLQQQKKTSNLLDLPDEAQVNVSMVDNKSGEEEEEELDADESADHYVSGGSCKGSLEIKPISPHLVQRFAESSSKKPQGGRASSLEVLPVHDQSAPKQKWARLLGLTTSDIGDEAEFVVSGCVFERSVLFEI